MLWRAAHGQPFGLIIGAQPEGRQHASVAEKIDRRNLLGQHQRITHGQHGNTHAKLDTLRPAGDHGQSSNRLEGRSGIPDTVINPNGIETALFHDIDEVPEVLGTLEWPAAKSYA